MKIHVVMLSIVAGVGMLVMFDYAAQIQVRVADVQARQSEMARDNEALQRGGQALPITAASAQRARDEADKLAQDAAQLHGALEWLFEIDKVSGAEPRSNSGRPCSVVASIVEDPAGHFDVAVERLQVESQRVEAQPDLFDGLAYGRRT